MNFLKVYDLVLERTHRAGSYQGALNADATEIAGHWTIPGMGSGNFLMIRQRGQQAVRKAGRRIVQPVEQR